MRKLVGVERITNVDRSGRLRLYGHAMRKNDDDWGEMYGDHSVEGRRPLGRPRKTWLIMWKQIW